MVQALARGVPKGTEHADWLGQQLVDMHGDVKCEAFLCTTRAQKLLARHKEALTRQCAAEEEAEATRVREAEAEQQHKADAVAARTAELEAARKRGAADLLRELRGDAEVRRLLKKRKAGPLRLEAQGAECADNPGRT